MTAYRTILVAAAVLLFPQVIAQGGLPEVVAAVEAARASEQIPHPDQPLWREAIRLAEATRDAAPGDEATLLALARLYHEVSWHVRAWDAWLQWQAVSGEALVDEEFAETATQLAFARQQTGDLAGAAYYLERLLAEQPGNAGALSRAAGVALEAGRSDEAIELLNALSEVRPDDPAVVAQLGRAELTASFGAAAAAAFLTGTSLYEQGDLAGSISSFEEALMHNASFTAAAVWAGRTALEAGQPGRAEEHWQRAVELDPADSRSAWFLGLARDQLAWGAEAATQFHEGLSWYEAGDLAAALESFEAAVRANAAYADALSWSARTAQELGDYTRAESYWSGVLELQPNNEGARYFLRQVRQKLSFGDGVSDEFLIALDAYQQARFSDAEAGFLRATEVEPEFAPAWGYLGQLYFAQGRYDLAADYYGEAHRLDPADEDYAFFSREAQRLAKPVD